MIGGSGVLPRLVTRYIELADRCYRVAVTAHDPTGRFQKGHAGPRSHPEMLKKADLDAALLRIYDRFFSEPPAEASSSARTSTSNSRCHGSDTRIRSGNALVAPSRSE
jgi:hypothetical protein